MEQDSAAKFDASRASEYARQSRIAEIATADYGRAANENFASLRQIRDGGVLESPMRWHRREVLELIRWSESELPDWKPGLPGMRGHWMRAFSCSALLKAAGEPENGELRVGWNQTLVQLIDSLSSIEPELYGLAAAFLAWIILRMEHHQDTEEAGFFRFGLLWLALRLHAVDEVIVALAELTAADAERQPQLNFGRWSNRWLLGTTCYDLRHAKWDRLGHSLTGFDLAGRSSVAYNWVSLIGSQFAGVASPN
jgi:hypothetical protein